LEDSYMPTTHTKDFLQHRHKDVLPDANRYDSINHTH